jgi:hypothetical protein
MAPLQKNTFQSPDREKNIRAINKSKRIPVLVAGKKFDFRIDCVSLNLGTFNRQ